MSLKVETDNDADDDDNYYGFGLNDADDDDNNYGFDDNEDDDGASALLMVLLQCLATTDSYY